MRFYSTDGRAYEGVAAWRFSRVGAYNQARGRAPSLRAAVPWGRTRMNDDSGRARERPRRKRSSTFEGARPQRLPHDAAVTVAQVFA